MFLFVDNLIFINSALRILFNFLHFFLKAFAHRYSIGKLTILIFFFLKTYKDSDQFMCVRDMYHNVKAKYCDEVKLEDLKILEEAKITKSSKLFIKSDIQYLESNW